MKQFLTLIQKEVWENKGLLLWLPLSVGGLILLLSLLGILQGSATFTVTLPMEDKEIQVQHNLQSLIQLASMTEPQHKAIGLYSALAVMTLPFSLVYIFSVVIYCLGSLYEERKDRSILFWKSLPVSDLNTVLSKLVFVFFLIPLAFIMVIWLTQMIWLFLATLVAWFSGVSAGGIVWQGAVLFAVWGQLVMDFFVNVWWAAPVIAWIMLVSAYCKRNPFLFASVPLLLLGLAESWLFHTGGFLRWVGERLLGLTGQFSQLSNKEQFAQYVKSIMQEPSVFIAHHLSLAETLIGLLLAGIMVVGMVFLRRFRDESMI